MSDNFENLERYENKIDNTSDNFSLNLLDELKGSSMKDLVLPAQSEKKLGLPSLTLEDEVARLEKVNQVKTVKDAQGNVNTTYSMDSQRVFDDIHKSNGDRIRHSYDPKGDVEGYRIDRKNGSTHSEFVSGFDTYSVDRTQGSLQVTKKDSFGEVNKVTDQEELNEVLQKERSMFTPPQVIGRRA